VCLDFKHSWFAFQIGESNTFGRIPIDLTAEETINKDTETPGGMCCFSLNSSGFRHYYLTSEYRSANIRILRDMVHLSKPDLQHVDMYSPRILKDEKAVKKVIRYGKSFQRI